MIMWRKSSHSAGNGACTEAAVSGGKVLVRDSTDLDSLILDFTIRAFREFTAAVKSGRTWMAAAAEADAVPVTGAVIRQPDDRN